jgi:glucosamine kinase
MKIGVDGGGTKTELILLDDSGVVLSHHVAPGCNPNVAGPENARQTLHDALSALLAKLPSSTSVSPITRTLLCMAGAPVFWREVAAGLHSHGRVDTFDDSMPVLELATGGVPGIALHGGTGSFVAARAPDGALHYAGGLGWRFGDPGSGYDLGRRTIARALLELQGWQLPTRLTTVLRDHTGLVDSRAITRFFYQHPEPNRQIAALAPIVLRLASEGDPAAHQIVVESCTDLLRLSEAVLTKLFAGWHLDNIPAGVSGPVLSHPAALAAMQGRSSLSLRPLPESPIEGIRRLLTRL